MADRESQMAVIDRAITEVDAAKGREAAKQSPKRLRRLVERLVPTANGDQDSW